LFQLYVTLTIEL